MNVLEALKRANPDLPLYSVHDPAFAPYGRVLPVVDPASLRVAMAQTAIPETGNSYTASVPALEAAPDVQRLLATVYGGMAIQAGCCNGHGFALNAEEYHKCSEVNYTTTGLVLLLALPSDLRDRQLDAASVAGFYLPPETMVEIYPRILHFAPCRVRPEGFNCLVVLTQGTNTPLPEVDPAAPGEEGLLWMKNKWLLCHPDSPQAQQGAFVGITGRNLTLSIDGLEAAPLSGQRGRIRAVCISERKGEQKHPVDRIVLRPHHGIEGDAHAGDWHRQVSLLAQESVDKMQEKVALPLFPGAFAENILCEGLPVSALPVGTRLRIGTARCEITQIGKTCHMDCAIRQQTGDCVMPREGVFAIVLEAGEARPGDEVVIEG